ncbi:MAG: elongation factor G, partial [Candidatus Omnitrophica bacterium]|nr:elongation factor G [Candidatus Omnitrophota bacterium]
GPFTAFVFKTVLDPFVGKLSYFRIFSGQISSNSSIYNATAGKKERIGQFLRIFGKKQEAVSQAGAGDIVAVAKLSSVQTGDTLTDTNQPIILTPLKFPEPAITFSLKPMKKGVEDKLAAAFSKLREEDRTINVSRDSETGETIISGVGDLHLDISINRLKDKFGAEVIKGIPKVAYKETITAIASVQGKYKRQTGGHGQYGDVWLRVAPLPRGKGFEFVNEIKGGAIPGQYIPGVEKGVTEAMGKGVLADYPLTDLKVTLYDGSFHTVDSSEIAFKIAASLALKKAVLQAKPILLEPIMSVEVSVPQEFVGDIIGDINAKRGKVLSIETRQNHQLVKALLPLAEMVNYATGLRSLTKGKAESRRSFSYYEVLPGHLSKKIMEAKEKKDG